MGARETPCLLPPSWSTPLHRHLTIPPSSSITAAGARTHLTTPQAPSDPHRRTNPRGGYSLFANRSDHSHLASAAPAMSDDHPRSTCQYRTPSPPLHIISAGFFPPLAMAALAPARRRRRSHFGEGGEEGGDHHHRRLNWAVVVVVVGGGGASSDYIMGMSPSAAEGDIALGSSGLHISRHPSPSPTPATPTPSAAAACFNRHRCRRSGALRSASLLLLRPPLLAGVTFV